MDKKIISYEDFRNALEVVKNYKLQVEEEYLRVISDVRDAIEIVDLSPDTLLIDSGCSVKLINILKANNDYLGVRVDNDTKLKELNGISIKKLKKCRGAGKKTIEEFKKLCLYANIKVVE